VTGSVTVPHRRSAMGGMRTTGRSTSRELGRDLASPEPVVGRSCRVITAFGNRRSLGVRSLAVRRLV
jgi:hypothetical protein